MSADLYLKGMNASNLDAYTRDNIWFMLKFSESGMPWNKGHWIDGDRYSGFLRNAPLPFADNPFVHIDTLDVMGQIKGPQKNLGFGEQYLWQIRRDPASGRYFLYNRRRGQKLTMARKKYGTQDFPILVAGNWNPPGSIESRGFFEFDDEDVDVAKSKATSWLWFLNKRRNVSERFSVISPGAGNDDIFGMWLDKGAVSHPNQTRYPLAKVEWDDFHSGKSFEVVAVDISSGVPEILAEGATAMTMFFDLAEDQNSDPYNRQQATYFYSKCKRAWANGPSKNPEEEKACQMFFANTDPGQRVKFVFEDTKRCVLPDYSDVHPEGNIVDDPVFKMACSGLTDGGAKISVEKCAPYLSKIGAGTQVAKTFRGNPVPTGRSLPPNAYLRTPIGQEYCKIKDPNTGESLCAPALKLWAKSDLVDVDAEAVPNAEHQRIKKEMCACYWAEDIKKKIIFTKNPALKTIVESSIPSVADIGSKMLNSILANWACENTECVNSSSGIKKTNCPTIQYQVCSQMLQTNNQGEITIGGGQQTTLQCQQQFEKDLGTNPCPVSTSGRTVAFIPKDGKNYCCYDDQEVIGGKCVDPCKPGFTRDSTGVCKCPSGKYDLNGACTDIPICKEGEELINYKCVPKTVKEPPAKVETPTSGNSNSTTGTAQTNPEKVVCPEHSKESAGKCVCDDGYVYDSVTGKCVVIKAPETKPEPKVEEISKTPEPSKPVEQGNFLEENKYWLIGGGVGILVLILLIVLMTR